MATCSNKQESTDFLKQSKFMQKDFKVRPGEAEMFLTQYWCDSQPAAAQRMTFTPRQLQYPTDVWANEVRIQVIGSHPVFNLF